MDGQRMSLEIECTESLDSSSLAAVLLLRIRTLAGGGGGAAAASQQGLELSYSKTWSWQKLTVSINRRKCKHRSGINMKTKICLHARVISNTRQPSATSTMRHTRIDPYTRTQHTRIHHDHTQHSWSTQA